MKILIIGASRGIGRELVAQSLAAGDEVVATARTSADVQALRAQGAHAVALDVADLASVAGLSWALDGWQFDQAWFVAGVLGPKLEALAVPTAEDFDAVMHTNVLGPMRVLPQLQEHLVPGARVAVVSSRMGSMGVRTAANAGLYRASKAAVNSVVKDLSIQWQGRAICVALHPGWVRTDMGGAGADLTPERSVADMRATVAGLNATSNGGFFNHDGAVIPW